jgi:hypothetical protein
MIAEALKVLGQVLGLAGAGVSALRARSERKRAEALPIERGHRIQSERYREASNAAGKVKDHGETR